MHDIVEELKQTQKLDHIDDIYCGTNFWEPYMEGKITPDDLVLLFSMDGAQLYEKKKSHCWIYIWIIGDIAPEKRYKKRFILPGAIVPGPEKPKNPDSFLFPGLYHVAALQNKGFQIWDSLNNRLFLSHLYLFLVEVDAVGAPELHGYVGHHGKQGC